MLTALGFGMVITFMYLIMSKRLSPLVALITVPIVFALLGGFGTGINEMMLDGIKKIAPTGVMLMFAILYFGVMIDAGLFDPLVGRILRLVKGDPLKIVMGTAILAMVPISLTSTTMFSDGPPYFPMARAIAGGLAFSTVVSLLFLPTIYAILDDMSSGAAALVQRARGVRKAMPPEAALES